MRQGLGRIAVIVACGWAAAASATELTSIAPTDVVPTMTYVSAASISTARTYGSYTGVGSLFISYQSTATTHIGSLCTGALVASNVVLTAAHCLAAGASDPIASVVYYLPSYGNVVNPGGATPDATNDNYTVANYLVNPSYDGNVLHGNDIAMVTLSAAATGHDVYGIYTGDPIHANGAQYTEFTRVGTGTVGDATGTYASGQDYYQRTGNNLYEYYGNQVFGSSVSSNILFSDFDDGTSAHDAFGVLHGNQQTGIDGESDSSPGDSGGPTFIDGLIAGITSFGTEPAGGCGSGKTDPYASASGSCINSSVGEMAGDTNVAAYSSFITSYIASANPVPEPATWAMMIAGFGMVGTGLRRQRKAAALA